MDTTEVKIDHDEGGESSQVSNGIVSYDSWEEMQQSWVDRAKVLMEEAIGFGFSSVFALASFDRLSDNGTTANLAMRRGNYYTCLGMIEDMKQMLMRGEM